MERENNLLMFKKDDSTLKLKIVVPIKLKDTIMSYEHNRQLHLGAPKMKAKIKDIFYWSGMNQDITFFCKRCVICQKNKAGGLRHHPRMKTFNPNSKFEIVSIDIAGPLPMTENGNRYILTIQDKFSKYTKMIPLTKHDAIEVTKRILQHWIHQFGLFKKLLSDRGSEFRSNIIKCFERYMELKEYLRQQTIHKRMEAMKEHIVTSTIELEF